MAKQILSLKTNSSSIPLANGGLKLSKKIDISKLEERPRFKSLYDIDDNVLKRITEKIKTTGYDDSQPVHVWVKKDEEGNVHYYLIDGYTRKEASLLAGEVVIPYFEHSFDDEEQAYLYALSLQVNRRNLSSGELIKNVIALMGTDYIQNTPGYMADKIAEEVGCSPRTVEKAIFVANNSDEDELELVKSNKKTINKSYNEKHPKKNINKKEVSVSEDESPFSNEDINMNSLDDNSFDSKNNSPFDMFDSDEINDSEDEKDETDVWIEENKEELQNNRNEGFADGFKKALYFCIAQFIAGKSPAEILSDKRVSNLSPKLISNFVLTSEEEHLALSIK